MRTPAKILILLIVTAVFASSALLHLMAAPVATAADAKDSAQGSEILLSLFPGTNSLSAPAWLKEGLRVYYRTSSGKLSKSKSAASLKLSELPLQKPEQISVNSMLSQDRYHRNIRKAYSLFKHCVLRHGLPAMGRY